MAKRTKLRITRFRRWAERHRAALNLRRHVPAGVVLANADRVPADWLPGGAASDSAAETGNEGIVRVMEYHLALAMPEVWEVFEALELASFCPGEGGGLPALDADLVLAVLDRQCRASRLAGARADFETELRAAEQDHQEELQRREGALLVQLHAVQEEIEQYYLDGLRQEAAFRNLQEECAALRQERETLRFQLSYMQEELASRSATSPAVSMPVPILRRIAVRMRRGLHRGGHGQPDSAREPALAALRASPWFDGNWYLAQYKDVADAGVDPAMHYLDNGAEEGRDPGPRFSTRFYMDEYADVADSGMNPLLHFIRHGLSEGRLPRRPA